MIKINDEIIEIKYFPNKELLINDTKVKKAAEQGDEIVITWHFENCEELVHLILIKTMLSKLYNKKIKLKVPYLPFSRMDRQIENQLFTLKYFGSLINNMEFESVEVFDLHSNQAFQYINNLVERCPTKEINKIIQDEEVDYVFLPDKGAFIRYTPLIEKATFWGEKVRNESNGRIEKYHIPNSPSLKNSTVLMVDDICSKGYTFFYALKELKSLGVDKVIIYVSHCEKAILDGKLLNSDIEKIYTTNSIMFTSLHDKIQII